MVIRPGEQVWYGTTYCKSIYVGATKIWPHSLMQTTTTSATWTVPAWATTIDVYALGGGGGGSDGGWTSSGAGGGAGNWGVATWHVDGGETVKAFCGQGGAGNSKGIDSTISMGANACVGAGGAAGSMGAGVDGGTPATKTDTTDDAAYSFPGGAGGTCQRGFWSNTITPGNPPGGGGGWGYSSSDKGMNGGNGQCWIVYRNCRRTN